MSYPSASLHSRLKIAGRLRIIGSLILLLGLGGAGLVYWTGTAPEDASADPATARDYKSQLRNTEINFGQTGVLTAELSEDLKRPGVQAVLILIASAILACGCFFIAQLMVSRVSAETAAKAANEAEVEEKT
jgi:flagellar basal body-associated protein FliL